MKILAFDTSTQWLSVACLAGGRWSTRGEAAGQAHSERLLPLIDAVLAEAGMALRDLDAIAFGAGPGSFTGVRIACGVAQGLALGAALPLVAVPTLEALAQAARHTHGAGRVAACLDARMREVYVAAYRYEDDCWIEAQAAAVLHPSDVALPEGAWFGAGDGFAAYPDLAARLDLVASDASIVPDARAIAELALPRLAAGETMDAAHARPLYVRHRVALTSAERAAGQRL
ncbi:MAG: tRNA (adenosine(37)-N6)-threonylcarbamoyltransferase complex dimerization subunit type 1 TsaB [Burkholderiales bacterium]|nr:tRNA (adenosine(37)-N6)-threonylcarbamoyltransferase complex dimerization subunit type 1 TsaB [Burkholderiales bacterium]